MENIKKNLRSVLLSKVGGVPLKNVEKDYKSLVGERLNWRQFGFGSFEAFLNDIPDVVKVQFKKEEMYAFGIAENMSYINPTARKAQFKDRQAVPKNGTCSDTGKMTVYFGNLPLDMTKEMLKSFLSEYLVMEIKTAKQSSGTGAWVVTSKDVGELMCLELNGKRYGERTLKVEPARNQNGVKKRDVPAQRLAGDFSEPFSSHSSAASVNSDGDSSSLRTQSSKNNSAVESLNSVDTLSNRKGVGEPQLYRGVPDEPSQQRRSRPDIANSSSAFALEATALNNGYAQPSSLLFGVKDSTNVSEKVQFNRGVNYGKHDSDFLWKSSSEPPPLVDGGCWKEFENGAASECFNSQRGWSNETYDEPPPLFSRDEFEKHQQKNEISSSASCPLNAALKNEKFSHTPHEGETFNLYVKKVPLGTPMAELSQLFKNAVKIVELSKQSYFAMFNTFQEVEDASRKSWMIRGSPIFVDVASKHKNLTSEPERLYQSTRNVQQNFEDQDEDLCSQFENLTCTVGSNNERKVQLSREKFQTENKSNVSRSQTTSNSNVQDNFQQRAVPMADMPPLVSRADHTNSRINVQSATSNVIPPLLSMEDLAKLRENQPPLSQKAQTLAKLCNSEMIQQDFPASMWNDTSSKQPCNTSNSQETRQAATQKTVSSKQLHNFPDFDGDYQTSNWNSALSKQMHDESNFQREFPKSSQGLPSMKQGNSSEIQDSSQICAPKVMPALKQHDLPNSCAKFQPSSDASESGGLDGRGCKTSLSSHLPLATTSASVSPLKPIPDEMRLKELQRMLMDTFPGDTLPTSYLLPEVIDVIIICAVPGFENSFFWGQVASEPYQAELQKMYDLIPRIDELSGSLVPASAALRRGAAKYGEDWCRIWIKLRGETASTVFFIDFGNFETVSNDNIYELPEEFWKVRPTALPFRVLDSGKLNISEHINQRCTAKVNKKCQRGCIFEIYDLQAQS